MEKRSGIDPKEADFSVNNVHFVRQSYWKAGSGIDFFKKAREVNGFLYLNSCTARLFLPCGEEVEAKSGSCLYLPYGSRYRLVFSEVFCEEPPLLINCSFFYEGQEYCLNEKPVLLPQEKDLQIKNIYAKLTAHTPSSAEIKSALWSLISLWLDCERAEKDRSEKAPLYLKKAKAYIEKNTATDISIASLAKMYGVSCSYFRKEFKRFYSLSPKEYSLQCRLEAACLYLETGELNISEVSKHLSFSSPSYFSRLFKEKKGISPIEFMKKSR